MNRVVQKMAPGTAKDYYEFELIEPRIKLMRVLIVDNLHRQVMDLSEIARRLPGFRASNWLKQERTIAALALENIVQNIKRLVRRPVVRVVHLSDVSAALIEDFDPDALVLSGTLSDFDLYNPRLFENFKAIVRNTNVPILGICGGHHMIGTFWGAEVVTLDDKYPWEKRDHRVVEYQYRFVKILQPDPIFAGVGRGRQKNGQAGQPSQVLKVWQNHALKLDRVPTGFVNLAKSYLCDIQALVKRSEEQLIYTVQFHIEKSFEDWNKRPDFWNHRVESRDGRIIFENFLGEALKHRGKGHQIVADR
ncbi:MAG: gamma-glutamyl-gamma-aminobutyrate hydrolase family protein [Acidobacteria bacterium]|nr:gamma-glutamyl-gamma-aminobutyrate hydrolase family protein [Acidobacteriota bacterium]